MLASLSQTKALPLGEADKILMVRLDFLASPSGLTKRLAQVAGPEHGMGVRAALGRLLLAFVEQLVGFTDGIRHLGLCMWVAKRSGRLSLLEGNL